MKPLLLPSRKPGWPDDPTSRTASGGVRELAVPAVVELFAVDAAVADGTVPSFARLIWVPVIVPFLIFAAVTAWFLICLVPTLFLASFEAAKAVAPPSSKNGTGSI